MTQYASPSRPAAHHLRFGVVGTYAPTRCGVARFSAGLSEGLRAQLSFLAQALATEARTSIAERPALAERRAFQHATVLSALAEVEKNVQPALALEAMMVQLRSL